MYPIKQSTALTVTFFAHDVNGDGVTGIADGSWTKRISKNAAAFVMMTVTVTELENGWYSIPLSTVHTDTLGILTVSLSAAAAKRVNLVWRVFARVNDDYAFPAVSGRSLDVAAAGTVLLQAATHTGAVIPTVTAVTNNVNAALANVAHGGAAATAQFGGGGGITANITGNLSGSVGSVTGAVGSVTGAVGSVTGGVGGSVSGDVAGKVLGGGASAITGVGARADVREWLGGVVAALSTGGVVKADVQRWLDAVVNALIAGRVDSNAQVVGLNAVDAVALATTAVDEISDGVWDENIVAAHGAADAAGRALRTLDSISDRTNRSNLNDLLGAPDDPSANQGTVVGAVWDEVLQGSTHNVVNSAGRRLRQITGTVLRDGTAQAGTANTITLDAGASTQNNLYAGELVFIVGGTGVGQARAIVQYNGTSKVAHVQRAWEINPSTDSEFVISGFSAPLRVAEGVAQAATATTITLDTSASASNDVYNGMKVVIYSGTGADQSRLIDSYVGATRVATIYQSWAITPDTTSVYTVLPVGKAETVSWRGSLVNNLIGGRVDANAQALGVDVVDATALAASAVDEIWDEVFAELPQAAPPATPQARQAIMLLYMALRNLLNVSATEKQITNDAGTVIAKKALSDTAGVYSEAEMVSGP